MYIFTCEKSKVYECCLALPIVQIADNNESSYETKQTFVLIQQDKLCHLIHSIVHV